jgi:GT2 family glycosyltransferase
MKDKTIGLASPLILDYDGNKIQTVGALFSDFLLYQYSIGEGFPPNTEFLPTFEASFTSGAAMILSKELINQIGLFDAKVPSYYEDTLLAFKTWLAGKRVVTITKSKVRHKTQGTAVWNRKISTFNWSLSRICLILDVYRNIDKLAKALLIFGICETIHLISERAFFKVLSYIKVFSWLLLNLKHIWTNRINYWSTAKAPPEALNLKFIRIHFPNSTYLRKGWSIQCKTEGTKYQNSLILANNKLTANS